MRNFLLIVLLGTAAVASWLWSRPTSLEQPRRREGGDAELGYYLRGARLLGTDESGRAAYRILADRLEEHPDQERLLLGRSKKSGHLNSKRSEDFDAERVDAIAGIV